MKPTASPSNTVTQQQAKDSRLNSGPGAAIDKSTPIASSASQQATERAKRGEPLQVDKNTARSPKQENL